MTLAPGALFDAWQVGDATISVTPLPPIAAGSEIDVTVNWPGAGSGRGGRLELQADVEAPNGLGDLVLWSQVVDPSAFRGGATFKIQVPADAPPTLYRQGRQRELQDPRPGRSPAPLRPRHRAQPRGDVARRYLRSIFPRRREARYEKAKPITSR